MAEVHDDVRLHGRAFTYVGHAGLVAGNTLSVMFVIDRPVRDVWPFFVDHNPWQNSSDHYYSAAVGEREGQQFTISSAPGAPSKLPPYEILRIVPEFLIVFHQPPLTLPPDSIFPGYGIVSPGVMSFAFDEYDERTHVAIFMQHASVMALPGDVDRSADEDVLGPWRDSTGAIRKWRDAFIPELKALVRDASAGRS
jgi:hypothetical protein